MAARERVVAVGVDGNEVLPVRNLNNPYEWTEYCYVNKYINRVAGERTGVHYPFRHSLRLHDLFISRIIIWKCCGHCVATKFSSHGLNPYCHVWGTVDTKRKWI